MGDRSPGPLGGGKGTVLEALAVLVTDKTIMGVAARAPAFPPGRRPHKTGLKH